MKPNAPPTLEAALAEFSRLRHRMAILATLANQASSLFLDTLGPAPYLIGDGSGRAEPANLDVVVDVQMELQAEVERMRERMRELAQARVELPKGMHLPESDDDVAAVSTLFGARAEENPLARGAQGTSP